MLSKIDINTIYKVIFTNKRDNSEFKKIIIKKKSISNKEVFQVELFTDTQVFHNNIELNEIIDYITNTMKEKFRQSEVFTSNLVYAFKYSNKEKLLSSTRKNNDTYKVESHNKTKQHILREGLIIEPLIDLGVMNKDGFVVKGYYDKFKQINKYIEIIDNILKEEDSINIIDFGCGKSYLTFILYYYLLNIKKIKFNIIGLDLKKDVIEKCNKIKAKYKYENISFYNQDIADFDSNKKIDMVISLHACDTATDFAIYHAVRLKSKYILAVPCCQHEINSQIKNNQLELLTKYGIIKERFATLLTDSIRANILEVLGYEVNVIEFIDITHSPKNVLIKAVLKNNNIDNDKKNRLSELLSLFNIKQTLYELLLKK
ncbi:MAG: class I SAM-dependent methyltransferase [Anaeroplasmataceae bacterium]